jgi:hypothetical protein
VDVPGAAAMTGYIAKAGLSALVEVGHGVAATEIHVAGLAIDQGQSFDFDAGEPTTVVLVLAVAHVAVVLCLFFILHTE